MIRGFRGLLLSRGYCLLCLSRRGIIVRTALVCVRTPVAAQSIAACASRLGVTTVRTATSEAEALTQLTKHPAELVLVDTAVARPDTVGFTRRVLALAPAAVLVLFGAEDRQVAEAVMQAGARGLIRSGDHDVVGTVTKALLLIGSRAPAPAASGCSERRSEPAGGARPRAAGAMLVSGRGPGGVMVLAQRVDAPRTEGARHPMLSERELQVLRGMAEGKSNAEIGRDLYVAEDTVKTHARRLFRKLKAKDRAHAVAVGFRTGALW
jgi:DNA-binding NarL/FixJ family response regulator